MSLVTYEEARPWAKSIAARVGARQMPPWHIDKTVGIQKFKNDRSLSDDQIDTILAWVAAGAPKGDPKDMPPPKMWTDESGWQHGRASTARRICREVARLHDAAGRAGRVVAADRRRPASPNRAGSARSRSVRSARTRARSRTTRSRASQQPEDMDPALFTNDPNVAGDGLFMEWAVGKNGDEMRPDSGRLMLPELEDHLGDALSRGRRRDHRAHRARRLVLPEGPGAEAPRGARAVQHLHRLGARRAARSTSRRTR